MNSDILKSVDIYEDEIRGGDILKQTFRVTDLASADWCLRKARDAEGRIQARAVMVKERIKAYQEWQDHEDEADRGTVETMSHFLEPWALSEIAKQKKRSVILPFGEVGFRKAPDSLDIIDETAAIAWAKANMPEAVKVTETVLKTPLKEWAKESGEIPDGCELRAGADRFYIDTVKS